MQKAKSVSARETPISSPSSRAVRITSAFLSMARTVSGSWTGRRSASVERTSTPLKSSGVSPDSWRYVTRGMGSTLRGQHRLHQGGDGPGVVVATFRQGPDDLPAALGRVVLAQLELALDPLDLDAEADDLLEHPLRE